MGQPTSATDVIHSLRAPVSQAALPVAWTCEAVKATFLRRGELVPPAEWSLMPGASALEREVAGELVAASRAASTRKAYGRHVRQWVEWAAAHGTCPLPADPGALQHFLVERAIDLDASEATDGGRVEVKGRLVMGTVTQIMAALSRLHVLAELPSPSEHQRIKEIMAGLRRVLTQAPHGAKAALTWDLLMQVLEAQQDAPVSASQLRTRVALELGAELRASAGQLARMLVSDVWIEGEVVVCLLPPGHRGARQLRKEFRVTSTPGGLLVRWIATIQTWPGTALFRDRTGKAMTRQGLHKVLQSRRAVLDAQSPAGAECSLADVRDRALLLAGWMSALRRSNLSALNWEHLTRTSSGWTFYIPRSKTDQEGRGDTVAVPAAPAGSPIADPAGAIDDWLDLVTATLGADPRRLRGVAVFVRIDKHGRMQLVDGRPVGISGSGISDIVKRRVRASGLEDRRHATRNGLWSQPGRAAFAAHSLRAGFVTEGLQRGMNPTDLIGQTGHTSVRMLQGYYRPKESPDLIAATTLMGRLAEASTANAAVGPARRMARQQGPTWGTPA